MGGLIFLASIWFTTVQPLNLGDSSSFNTVPAYPTQTHSQIFCLDLSNKLFDSVNHACGTTLDRSRCCSVLAAWLFTAFARIALEVSVVAVDAEQAFGAIVVDVTTAEVSSVVAAAVAPATLGLLLLGLLLRVCS